MDWQYLLYNLGYVTTAIVVIYLSGWLIYDKIATKNYCLSKALFEDRNLAAGIEVIGFLVVEVLIAVSALSGDEIKMVDSSGQVVINYLRDLEAVAVTILFCNITFFLFRWLIALFLKVYFRGKLDNHGEKVRLNNEIFNQRNMGASLFSLTFLLIMYFMIIQEDFLGTQLYQVESYINMAAVLLTGVLVYFLYNIFFIASGHTTLDELFIDNNVGVGLSLTGLMFTVLHLQSKFIGYFEQGEHFFNLDGGSYLHFLILITFIFIFRKLFTILVGFFSGKNYQKEFLVEDNPVVGILDFGFVLSAGMLLGVVI